MIKLLRKHAYLALLFTVAVILYLYTFDSKLHLGGDNAEYYQLAQGFAQFKGYVSVMLPSEPAAQHFPPGYPFILSIPMILGITGIVPLKLLNGLFFLASIWLIYRIAKELMLSELVAFAAAFLTAINVHILNYSFILMSEMPYTFFSLLSFWAFLKHLNQKLESNSINTYKWLFIASVAAIASYFIRSIGIAIPIAILLYLLFKRKWKDGFVVAITTIFFILPWQFRMKSVGGGNYASQLMMKNPYRSELGQMEGLSDWLTRVGANVNRYLGKEFSAGLINGVEWAQNAEISMWMLLVGLIILLTGLFGVFVLNRKLRWFVLLFLMGHFGILLLWPDVWFGTRFMLSLIPVMYLLIAVVVSHIGSKFLQAKMAQNLGIGLLAIAALLSLKPIHQFHQMKQSRTNPRYAEYFELAEAASKQLPENAVISCRKPAFFYLYSNRKVTGYAFTEDQQRILDGFIKDGVTHVVVDNLGFSTTPRYLVPLIQQQPEHFKLIAQKEGSNTYLFEFIP